MTIFSTLSAYGIIPVVALDDTARAIPLADALIKGGLPIAEITFRTPAARKTIEIIARERPELNVGAGTVLTDQQLIESQEAGAKFALAPGLDLDVLALAKERKLPFAPGIMTPTDLQAALKFGCQMVKFFPAMAAGGPKMLSNISAPYAHTGIGFNPTGGITLENLPEWLAMPQVRAVGGTWIATRDDIAAGNWNKITENASAAVARIAEIRGAH